MTFFAYQTFLLFSGSSLHSRRVLQNGEPPFSHCSIHNPRRWLLISKWLRFCIDHHVNVINKTSQQLVSVRFLLSAKCFADQNGKWTTRQRLYNANSMQTALRA